MSPTSYQAAPPRGTQVPEPTHKGKQVSQRGRPRRVPREVRAGVETCAGTRDHGRRALVNKPPPRPPPPLPPRARAQAARPPLPAPTDDGIMSTRAKMSLADIALQLRDEQLQARVVHYKAELETSPELDSITAQVVAELQKLQKAAGLGSLPAAAQADRSQIEIELIGNLKTLLARLFRGDK